MNADPKLLQQLVDDSRIDELLALVTFEEISSAWCAYQVRYAQVQDDVDDEDWWAVQLLMDEEFLSDERMRSVLDLILEQADTEDVFRIFAAGPLEAFIDEDESRLSWIEQRAAESPRFKEALSRVWISREPPHVIERVERAAGVPLGIARSTRIAGVDVVLRLVPDGVMQITRNGMVVYDRARQIGLGVCLAAVLIGGGVFAAVAVDGASSSNKTRSASDGLVAYVSTSSSPPPIAASVALRRVVASLNGGRVRSDIVWARIGKAPPAVPSWVRNAAVPALNVRVKIPGLGGPETEALWQAELLVGALVELSGTHRSLQSDIGTIDISAQLPDGRVISDLGGAMGGVARGQQFAGADDTDAEVRNFVERRASALGLTVDSVTTFRAQGAAPAVVLTVPNVGAAIAKRGLLEAKLFGATPRYEGYFLEIRGSDGRPYVRRGFSSLTATGLLWPDSTAGG